MENNNIIPDEILTEKKYFTDYLEQQLNLIVDELENQFKLINLKIRNIKTINKDENNCKNDLINIALYINSDLRFKKIAGLQKEIREIRFKQFQNEIKDLQNDENLGFSKN